MKILVARLFVSIAASTNLSVVHAFLSSISSMGRIRTTEGVVGLCATKTSREQRRKRARPIDPQHWPERYPAKDLCSRCGLCETSFVTEVKSACAFLGPGMARIDALEEQVHGRQRDPDVNWESLAPGSADEARFGVLHEPIRLAKGNRIEGAQWTGVVTGIASAMLESGAVDAVVCIATDERGGDGAHFGSPEPIVARTTADVLRGRGVKPSLAPSLKVLDEIERDDSIRKLLFCGVGCAVQAFRSVQDQLGLEEVYVLGTNCADNSPTPQAARNFIQEGVKVDDIEQVQGYEFMQDFKVHVKSKNSYVRKPYFTLPGTIAEASIAKSCRACFDYTNALADVVVGYMGAPLDEDTKTSRMDQSFQTLTIRNERGAHMVDIAQQACRLIVGETTGGEGSHEKLASATVTSDAIVNALVGKPVPEKGMPELLGQIMAFGMRRIGPKGINFARYSIDYHILRNYLFLLNTNKGSDEKAMVALPQNARDIVNYYLETDKAFAEIESNVRASANDKGLEDIPLEIQPARP